MIVFGTLTSLILAAVFEKWRLGSITHSNNLRKSQLAEV